MMKQQRLVLIVGGFAVLSIATLVAQDRTGRPQRPTRDTSAQRDQPQPPAPAGKARISGRVVALDSGRPIRRARVFINATELPGGRGTLTDDQGTFDFTELPAGRYTLTVSRTGFISLSYGQRRPLMAGTPLQLGDSQELTGIDFQLPRGSVITGHVYDESGDPLPGAVVQVLRYQYAQGSRQLVPAGGGQTDDQGTYRLWGLNPGEYYISATSPFAFGARGLPVPPDVGPGGGIGATFVMAGPAGGVQTMAIRGAPGGDQGADPVGYAPTFYPGVASAYEARAVTVALSSEVASIDFGLLMVRTARVSGSVSHPDGTAATGGMVNLLPGEGTVGLGPGRMFGSRIHGDGAFDISNVPPGRYILSARGERGADGMFANVPVTIAEGDSSQITVILAPGGVLSGTVTFQGSGAQSVPDASQVRVMAPPVDFRIMGPNSMARVDADGAFTLDNVSAGEHWIRTQGAMRGWTLKSVLLNGREMIDTPLEVRSGEKLSGLTVVFTDKLSEINGTILDERDQPIPDFTVLAFPTDDTLWRPQSRHIATARPDQNGKFQIRGLPAGEYFLATIDPSVQGEWYESAFLQQQRTAAKRVLLADGDVKTQDFKLSLR